MCLSDLPEPTLVGPLSFQNVWHIEDSTLRCRKPQESAAAAVEVLPQKLHSVFPWFRVVPYDIL